MDWPIGWVEIQLCTWWKGVGVHPPPSPAFCFWGEVSNSLKAGPLKMNTALSTVQEWSRRGGRRCKKITLNDLVHLTPLRIPLMNPPWILNDICRNSLLRNRKKIAEFLMRTFTCRSTFLYDSRPLWTWLTRLTAHSVGCDEIAGVSTEVGARYFFIVRCRFANICVF